MLVGAGALGRRHIEALKEIPIEMLYVYDPFIDNAGLNVIVGEIVNKKLISVKCLTKPTELKGLMCDLVIDATLSSGRLDRLKNILSSVTTKYVILEKLLYPSKEELLPWTIFADGMRNSPICFYVHCQRPEWPIYKKLKSIIESIEKNANQINKISFYAKEFDFGSNLIHLINLCADMIEFKEVKSVTKRLKVLEHSRRVGIVSVFGSTIFNLDETIIEINGNKAMESDQLIIRMHLSSGDTIGVEEGDSRIFWNEECVWFGERSPFVSESSFIYNEVLNNTSRLPNLEESLFEHSITFEILGEINGKLS